MQREQEVGQAVSLQIQTPVACFLSKTTAPVDPITFPNSPTNWWISVQIYEPIWDICHSNHYNLITNPHSLMATS